LYVKGILPQNAVLDSSAPPADDIKKIFMGFAATMVKKGILAVKNK